MIAVAEGGHEAARVERRLAAPLPPQGSVNNSKFCVAGKNRHNALIPYRFERIAAPAPNCPAPRRIGSFNL